MDAHESMTFDEICDQIQHLLDKLEAGTNGLEKHHNALRTFKQQIAEAYNTFKQTWTRAARATTKRSLTEDHNSQRPLPSPDPTTTKKARPSSQPRKPKVGCEKKPAPLITFPHPPRLSLPPAAAASLTSTTARLGEAQWKYWAEHAVLPVTLMQWQNLPLLLDQVQHQLDEDGVIVFHPDWKQDVSQNDLKQLKLGFKTIRAVKCHRPHITFRIDSREKEELVQIGCPQEDAIAEKPLDLLHFEQLIADPHWQVLYANDVDDTQERYSNIIPATGIVPRLRHLAGDELPKRDEHLFPGVNDIYLYLGARSSSFYLHVEDENLYSFNMVHVGQKTWRIFAPREKAVIENYFRQHVTSSDCSQFVRHQNAYIPIQVVQNLDLHPLDVQQCPGQVVVTTGDAYHQGFNAEPCISEAINYARRWRPLQYSYCHAKFCHLSSYSLCVYQRLDQPIQINELENISVGNITAARSALEYARQKHDGQTARQSVHGSPQNVMIQFILLIGIHLPIGDVDRFDLSLCDSPCLEAAYSILKQSRLLAHYSEIHQNYATMHIYNHIQDLLAQKRRKRTHKKGQKSHEVPREYIVAEVASGLASSDAELSRLNEEFNSYTFRNTGAALTKLVNIYGHAILPLLPTRDICDTIGVKRSWLGDVLKPGVNGCNKATADLFIHLMELLRPDLKNLCVEGPYREIWLRMSRRKTAS